MLFSSDSLETLTKKGQLAKGALREGRDERD